MAKLLREKYKTWEGAHKRAGFENGIAKSEFDYGRKAKHYRYAVIKQDGCWRVQRLSDDVRTGAAFATR